MTEPDSELAKRAQIAIGSITVDGFMLADGSYRLSQSQAAEAVGKPPVNALRFLQSKAIKALLGDSYTDYTPDKVVIESDPTKRGQSRFNALPLDLVTAYWINQCFQGNKQALALVMALATESLDRRFDEAFGIERSTSDYNAQLSDRVQNLEQILDQIGEGLAFEDNLRRERDELLNLLKQNGIDPYALPESEEG